MSILKIHDVEVLISSSTPNRFGSTNIILPIPPRWMPSPTMHLGEIQRPFASCPPHPHLNGWQSMAAELNQSGTAFLLRKTPESSPDSSLSPHLESNEEIPDQPEDPSISDTENFISWFTPFGEEAPCGHATLASAHFLFSEGYVSGESITFHNHKKILGARRIPHPTGRIAVELHFPLNPAMEAGKEMWPMMAAGLGGVEVVWAGKSELDYLVLSQYRQNCTQIIIRYCILALLCILVGVYIIN